DALLEAAPGPFGAGGFVPVGSDLSFFNGRLDGAGHTITGLTIARPGQDNVGLIGFLGSGGRVSGLGLVGGSVSGRNYVGGLVGSNGGGTVTQSYTSGSVTGAFMVGGLVGSNGGGEVSQSYATGSVTGTTAVGGLVGWNAATVSQSYTTGSLTGVNSVGGLVGYNSTGATVSQSYASGSVSGRNYVGGLVGDNVGGTVSQSYASGSLTGDSEVGGLVGRNRGGGTVSQSYASGSVSGTTDVGGLAGSNSSQITSSYWDTQSTGQASGVGNGLSTGATGLTSSQARSGLSNYTGFDPAVWYQAGDLRPILRSEAVQVGGVYQVSNLHQLQLMGADLGGSYVLTRDLDASATAGTATSSGLFGAGGFVPVGSDLSSFTGRLDGVGRTITGLTITRPNQDYVGLIGSLGTGGRVSGVGLVGGSVGGRDRSGSLVGSNDGGTVSRSYATGSVTGFFDVGGLVGYNSGGTVSESYASGSVSGNSFEGGLVGTNDGGRVSQSYATGS
ncbi:GLUG motif-containing protein, partial [Methylorubrum podarium]|uniref:GLUG motif-containing protein n=1 Tax=Methylorubrum podarium TaxID=200476 RepID=UPI0024B4BA9F